MIAAYQQWAEGYGVVRHCSDSARRVHELVSSLEEQGRSEVPDMLAAADRLCNMGLWLTLHMIYARRVNLDGRPPGPEDFKSVPAAYAEEALAMVPVYVGYLLANALSGKTRGWLSGVAHCGAAIDAIKVLTRNLDEEQLLRYPLTEAGLTQLCCDYSSFAVAPDGRPVASAGSRLSALTAGNASPGGCPGNADLQYVHMPLPGQELVALLSTSAFQSQTSADWAPQWWRGEDSGLVLPIMLTGRNQAEAARYEEQLSRNGFSPRNVDAHDPAAIAWAIITMAADLQEEHRLVVTGVCGYPVRMPCALASSTDDPGVPPTGNPALDSAVREQLTNELKRLYVAPDLLQLCAGVLMSHKKDQRQPAKDHWLGRLRVDLPMLPMPETLPLNSDFSAMEAIDDWFSVLVQNNPFHRFRVADPGGLRNNRLTRTTDILKHRVTRPDETAAESLNGGIITASNEEAVVAAALANKQGVNLVICNEAPAIKMLCPMRQEIMFSRQLRESGREAVWLSVPVVVTSHTWENGLDGGGGQHCALPTAWLEEMSDVAPVLFPCDAATTVTTLERLYGQRGSVAVVVVPRLPLPVVTDENQAWLGADEGLLVLSHDDDASLQLIAVGAYQLQSVQRAAQRLRANGVACSVVALIEPGRFRMPRDAHEAAYVHSAEKISALIPEVATRIIVTHTCAEIMTGVLRPLDRGAANTRFLGYRNHGGALDVFGMQYANQQTWAHIVKAGHDMLVAGNDPAFLSDTEYQAVTGRGDPDVLR